LGILIDEKTTGEIGPNFPSPENYQAERTGKIHIRTSKDFSSTMDFSLVVFA
jgi:hypothetical protein